MFLSRKPSGIVLILLRCKYLKEKCWNKSDEKEKQRHGNTKTYKSVNRVFLSRKPPGIVLILLRAKVLKENKLK